jgi:hypothetical protein
MQDIRIGLIGRADLGGLGIETRAFVKHMKPTKLMLVKIGTYQHFFDEFPGATIVSGNPTNKDLEEFIKDIDVLFCLETPYNWEAFNIARKRGIKSVLRINYEWLLQDLPSMPDVFINPVDWYMEKCPKGTVYLKYPVDREKHPFRLRTKANTFLHIVGHGGGFGRNGTKELFEALRHTKSDFKLIVHSQMKLETINDPRIIWRVGNYKDESEMYKDADVLLYPRLYAGQSLPMNEAMSAGLAIMMTDMSPQNKFLPKELLIPTCGMTALMISRPLEMAVVDPKDIAQKIDEWAGKDITRFSQESDRIAEEMSWETLKPKYLELFK